MLCMDRGWGVDVQRLEVVLPCSRLCILGVLPAVAQLCCIKAVCSNLYHVANQAMHHCHRPAAGSIVLQQGSEQFSTYLPVTMRVRCAMCRKEGSCLCHFAASSQHGVYPSAARVYYCLMYEYLLAFTSHLWRSVVCCHRCIPCGIVAYCVKYSRQSIGVCALSYRPRFQGSWGRQGSLALGPHGGVLGWSLLRQVDSL
jgi:hypothetical protein